MTRAVQPMSTTSTHRLQTVLATAVLAVAAAACGGKGKLTPPPPPLRPEAKPVEKPVTNVEPADCPPTDPNDLEPAKTFDQRSIPESEKLANMSVGMLQQAQTAGIGRPAREQLITDAVTGFIHALLADPYNVNATYNLAAAYARIDRKQCAINLLERLIQMRDHESRKEAVEKKLDRLLGRNKQSLDPDFNDMRGDARFRELITKMCEGSADPACVFGNH